MDVNICHTSKLGDLVLRSGLLSFTGWTSIWKVSKMLNIVSPDIRLLTKYASNSKLSWIKNFCLITNICFLKRWNIERSKITFHLIKLVTNSKKIKKSSIYICILLKLTQKICNDLCISMKKRWSSHKLKN